MNRKSLLGGLLLFLIMTNTGWAQDEDIQTVVDNRVEKMQHQLNLTDAQAVAIKPIVKNYIVQHHAILEEMGTEGIIDHVAVKGSLKKIRELEYQQLGKILTDEQLKKWIDRDNLRAAMNPDAAESPEDDEASLNANGVDLKF